MKKNSIVTVVRYFILMVVNENTIVSIVKDFILIVAKVKQRRDFRSGLKQRSERSQ